jgi:hypothetical protein
MGMSLAFHIIFAAIGVSLPLILHDIVVARSDCDAQGLARTSKKSQRHSAPPGAHLEVG